MATTFTTAMTAAGVQPRANAGETCVSATYEIDAALVVNDVIQMVKIPADATILEIVLSTDSLDSGSAIVLDVGDASSTARFIDGSTIAQAGGVSRLDQAGGHLYKYAAESTIDVLVETAPTTGETSGTINIAVKYQLGAI